MRCKSLTRCQPRSKSAIEESGKLLKIDTDYQYGWCIRQNR
uniref:Uncharacterized protein n=1 Tax=Arundo donax TaxID=35708 RepID=A0A0A9CK14_ARUDO